MAFHWNCSTFMVEFSWIFHSVSFWSTGGAKGHLYDFFYPSMAKRPNRWSFLVVSICWLKKSQHETSKWLVYWLKNCPSWNILVFVLYKLGSHETSICFNVFHKVRFLTPCYHQGHHQGTTNPLVQHLSVPGCDHLTIERCTTKVSVGSWDVPRSSDLRRFEP